MPSLTTSDKRALPDLLAHIAAGKVQLPDFQRGWVWDDNHIRSLLASISRSFPIGAVMMLETGNPQVRFAPRLVEGALSNGQSIEPQHLLLDGQQRLTSLFQTLFCAAPVATFDARKKQIQRFYYLDIEKALDSEIEREDAIVALPLDRMVRNFRGEILHDYSTPEAEYRAGLFPLNIVFDPFNWRNGYSEFWNYEAFRLRQLNQFEREVIEAFKSYQLPIIFLTKETPKEAVCQVFEKVNTGGVSLTVFELLTATFAADDFNLRDDWQARQQQLRAKSPLENLSSDEFLQVITLLVTRQRFLNAAADPNFDRAKLPAVSAKRRDVLKLTVEDYTRFADAVTEGFKSAAALLRAQKIFSAYDLPYQTQLVPLAAILTALGRDARETDGPRSRIARWFWCGVCGELYGSATETRFANDVMQVLNWLQVPDAPEPNTIRECNFSPERLETMRSRNSAAYKGLHALLMRAGGLDFLSGHPIEDDIYQDESIDIHHIFPQKWCIQSGIPRETYDSIINKAPLSARTNRIIGGDAPSLYLGKIENRAQINAARLDTILATHLIPADILRGDDFDTFFHTRKEQMLQLIESATGRSIARP